VRDPDAYIEAVSAVVGLTVAEAFRPGVARYLALAADMARTLETVELDDGELALAPVYLPPDAGPRGDE
jgi:hypothetical protein